MLAVLSADAAGLFKVAPNTFVRPSTHHASNYAVGSGCSGRKIRRASVKRFGSLTRMGLGKSDARNRLYQRPKA